MITKKTSNEDRTVGVPISTMAVEKWTPLPFPLAPPNLVLQRHLDESRQSLGYQVACIEETFSDELWAAMEARGLTQSQFADKADVSKQFLTKIFRGGNCTIETIVKLAYALDYHVNLHLTPNDVGCSWIHGISTGGEQFKGRNLVFWAGMKYDPIELGEGVQNAIVAIES